ncbi:MAG: CinA family protein [Rhodospirillales bacterium]
MFTDADLDLAAHILGRCRERGLRLAVAESCTGGLIAGLLTTIAGSSDVFERGFVTYSNVAKEELLGVPAEVLRTNGAVSEETARAMAEGALAHSPADASLAVTGIAGPGGGSPGRPVGLVHMAAGIRGSAIHHAKEVFPGDRQAIRLAAVRRALVLLREALAG